ncbi:alpha/beta fold hydrolase [Kineosporia succinea]|uniref:ABC-2 type transport system ATP-binding protein n=1 Tax=Kineosporia succinea TaxID=84632 RepID=A0ABT9P3A6_9ACTN|nr:alpha/beta fold hydrolase [Kineosporia succinea]MDP9826967.1 ABC-2 type transport system ATP-binding protein [Kineosporia succinea]
MIARLQTRRILLPALILVIALVAWFLVARASSSSAEASFTTQDLKVDGTPEADGDTVTLDARLYLPERTPAPAVLLAHGFGGSKDSVAGDAEDLADRGYVVLTYSARGMGTSGGLIHLDSPDYEVKDGQRMLDQLAARPEVEQRDGDPVVGVVGASYGGALALMLAGTDDRVDAIVPAVTWNDLRQSLFPQFAGGGYPVRDEVDADAAGVFKKQWTATLLGSTLIGSGGSLSTTPSADQLKNLAAGDAEQAVCGRLAKDLCLGYVETATTGRPTAGMLKLLGESSPARVADRISADTLLIQGQGDSLFPLSEADANAQAIAGAGADVKLYWQTGGHDSGVDTEALRPVVASFLDSSLRNGSVDDVPGFRVDVASGTPAADTTAADSRLRTSDLAPGVSSRDASGGVSRNSTPVTRLELDGNAQFALAPPGATPSAITSLPGAGALLNALGSSSALSGSSLGLNALPGETATFETAPLSGALTVTGSSRVTVRVASSADDATLFASLLDVDEDGGTTLPSQLVSPVRVTGLADATKDVTIALPSVVRDIPAGHRLRVVLSTTDQAYAMPQEARLYRVELSGDGILTVPRPSLTVTDAGSTVPWGGVIGLAAGTLLLGLLLLVRRRRGAPFDESLADVPLSIENLGKAYKDGFRAVSDLSFRVERGQVLGLLGPNGAGKTTSLRMLMGLIMPSEGRIRIFGHEVRPGAPVLSRLGSFIEGPGFLPHLSGRDNLQLYWRSTGRTAEPHLDVALEIAGLGTDVERKVRTYSQGMRQRLAIAQAMLGLPDLLVLDEPTNGLDPPQIREMREVLGRYAATGRTVVVSSHLLAEVEQSCTHVVVMAAGRLVAQGRVDELVGDGASVAVTVDDVDKAVSVAAGVPGVAEVHTADGLLVVQADLEGRAELVRALVLAGVRVSRIAPQRGLEETFLALVGEEN